jgi:integrase
MPRGTVVPFLRRAAGTDDVRPRDPPDHAGAGHLFALFDFLGKHKWPTLSKSAQASYRQLVRLAASLAGDGYPSVGDVAQWVTDLRRAYPPPEGFTDSWTVHGHWKNLVAVYNDGQEWGQVIGANPAALLKLKKPTPRARCIVDVAELWPTILDACNDLRERTLMDLALKTGARKGELLALYPSDLVTTCEPWRLLFTRQRPLANRLDYFTPLKVVGGTKAVPIVDPDTRAMLAELIAQGRPQVWMGRGRQTLVESELLFPYRGNNVQDLRRRCGAVAPGAFPPGDWLHTLRHTFAVFLNRSGASDEEVQHALGHKSAQSTTQVYINAFARPVDVGPIARGMAALKAGVTAWGAPPGSAAGPPDVGKTSSGPKKRTATAPTVAVQERSKPSTPTITKESTSCVVPSQKRLPGMQVQPVVVKPLKSTSSRSVPSAKIPARSPSPARKRTGGRGSHAPRA